MPPTTLSSSILNSIRSIPTGSFTSIAEPSGTFNQLASSQNKSPTLSVALAIAMVIFPVSFLVLIAGFCRLSRMGPLVLFPTGGHRHEVQQQQRIEHGERRRQIDLSNILTWGRNQPLGHSPPPVDLTRPPPLRTVTPRVRHDMSYTGPSLPSYTRSTAPLPLYTPPTLPPPVYTHSSTVTLPHVQHSIYTQEQTPDSSSAHVAMP